MSTGLQPSGLDPADRCCGWSGRIADLIASRLADARAHAENGRLADANQRLIELRAGLVGRIPGEGAGLLRDAQTSLRRRAIALKQGDSGSSMHWKDRDSIATGEGLVSTTPIGGCINFLEAVQLSAQAIFDLATVSAASSIPSEAEGCSAALAAWELRHRERIGRWTQNVLSDSQAALHRTFCPHRQTAEQS
jgi:hypothetical protein